MTTDPTGGWAKAVEKSSEAATEAVKAGRDVGGFIAPALRHLVARGFTLLIAASFRTDRADDLDGLRRTVPCHVAW